MAAVLMIFVVVAGAFLPLQAGVNARLGHFVGGPVRASLVSFTVGALALLVVVLVAYRGGAHRAGDAPWWAWIGGALGAFYVVSAVVVAPRIGAAAYFGVLVAAQLVTGVLADRFGWLAFRQHDLTPLRLVGVALLIGGAVLVRAY
jgi:bacterial/archaeal transporter family-2 protein